MNKEEQLKRVKEIDHTLKQISLERNTLDAEKELLLEQLEENNAFTLREQKYWKAGNQDFFYVGKREYIQVSCYQGGGGFTISQGLPPELDRDSYYNRHEPERTTKEAFEEALKSQLDRISKIKES